MGFYPPPPRILTRLAGKSTMNEDGFPIEHGDSPVIHSLVFRGVHRFGTDFWNGVIQNFYSLQMIGFRAVQKTVQVWPTSSKSEFASAERSQCNMKAWPMAWYSNLLYIYTCRLDSYLIIYAVKCICLILNSYLVSSRDLPDIEIYSSWYCWMEYLHLASGSKRIMPPPLWRGYHFLDSSQVKHQWIKHSILDAIRGVALATKQEISCQKFYEISWREYFGVVGWSLLAKLLEEFGISVIQPVFIHPRSLTARTWKMMDGSDDPFLLGRPMESGAKC